MTKGWCETSLAYREGWLARKRGELYTANPHTVGTAQYQDWADGWTDNDILQWS